MDGTLLQSNNQIGEETRKALKKADSLGIKVVPASGRPLPGVIPYMNELGITGDNNYAVLYNGGLVQSISGRVLISHQFNFAEFEKMLEIQKRNSGVNLHFMKEYEYWTLDRKISLKMAKMSFVSGATFVIKDFNEIPEDFRFIKAEFTGSVAAMDKLPEYFPVGFTEEYNVARSDPQIWEINKKAASKSNGIHELAVMIFGDQGNDMSMFENFDFKKIAMGNAIEAIKEKADYVTDDNDHNGIAKAIKKFVL